MIVRNNISVKSISAVRCWDLDRFADICTSCGRLLDLELDMKSIEEVNRLAGENFDGIITSSSTLFYGECSDCIRKS